MSKILTLLIVLVLIGSTFLVMRTNKDSETSLILNPPKNASEDVVQKANFDQWREFVSSQFKVLFPELPQYASDNVFDSKTNEPRKYDTYIAGNNNGSAFMVSTITFSEGIDQEKIEDSLESIVDDMVARKKENKLVKMEKSKFKESPALDFTMTSGDFLVGGKVIAHGDKLFMLSMINKNQIFNPQELEFFLSSFTIIDDADKADSKSSE